MKSYIKNIPIVGDLLSKVYIRIKRKKSTDVYQKKIIDRYLKNIDTEIVQIGSNDGITADPIYDLVLKNDNWKALYVEPVPYLFKVLKNNFPDNERFRFENSALNDGSKQIFYYVSKDVTSNFEDLPRWHDQIGSFNKSHIIKHLNGILEPYIKELNVQGITLDQLFLRYNILNLGLLHIDTEGHDWKILSQLNLSKYEPYIILFEHKHLNKEEIEEAVNFLEHLYWILNLERDFLCILKTIVPNKDLKKIRKHLINTL